MEVRNHRSTHRSRSDLFLSTVCMNGCFTSYIYCCLGHNIISRTHFTLCGICSCYDVIGVSQLHVVGM